VNVFLIKDGACRLHRFSELKFLEIQRTNEKGFAEIAISIEREPSIQEKRGGTGASFGEDTGTCPSARVGLAMNDSCEDRVSGIQVRANQVFSLETPTTILHGALALFRGICVEKEM
jgi:hypothetical protein